MLWCLSCSRRPRTHIVLPRPQRTARRDAVRTARPTRGPLTDESVSSAHEGITSPSLVAVDWRLDCEVNSRGVMARARREAATPDKLVHAEDGVDDREPDDRESATADKDDDDGGGGDSGGVKVTAAADKKQAAASAVDSYARAALRVSCAAIVGVRARASVDAAVRKRASFYMTRETCEILVELCEALIGHIGRLAHDVAEHAGRAQVTVADTVEVLDRWVTRVGGDGLQVLELAQYAGLEELASPRVIPEFPRKRVRPSSSAPSSSTLYARWPAGPTGGHRRPRLSGEPAENAEGEVEADEAEALGTGDELAWDERLLRPPPTDAGDWPSDGAIPTLDTSPADTGPTSADPTARSAPSRVPGAGAHIASWMPAFPPVHTFMDTPMYASADAQDEMEKLRQWNEERLQVEDALARARGMASRALDNPYLQPPKAAEHRTRSSATTRTTGTLREPTDTEVPSAAPRGVQAEVLQRAERILTESGGAAPGEAAATTTITASAGRRRSSTASFTSPG